MADKTIGPGTVLAGRFRLEDLIQETAGAKFWRATDQILARNVAVHVIDADDRRADALLVAARTSATVTDGHLLRVLDAARVDGFVFVVSEWGSGLSLDKLLSEGPLPPRRAAWLVKEVAEAITRAHTHGVAHGRLVPENVIVTESGAVKLVGFVVDRVLNGRPPAVAGGEPPSDHESDVANLAALLYASLTGRWPGPTSSILPSAPRDHGRLLRPRQVRAGIPRTLDAICDRVLEPTARDQGPPIESAREICAALSDFVGDPVAGGQPAHEATAVLDAELLRAGLAAEVIDTAAVDRPAGEPDAEPAVERTADQQAPTEAPAQASDPEATQAGTPVFSDDSGDSWVPGAFAADPEARRQPPPPPPQLPDPEPRPLFAPEQALTGARDAEPAPDTGHGGPMLPPWDDERTGSTVQPRDDAGGRWLKVATLLGLLALLTVAVVVAFNLGRDAGGPTTGPDTDPSGPPTEQVSLQPVQIASVTDFDPLSDNEENPELADLAVDGDPATAWRTLTYFDPLEQQKGGVGLLLDLGQAVDVAEVRLRLGGRPTAVELLAAPGAGAAPGDVESLEKVAAAPRAGQRVTLTPEQPVNTRYLVVWLTSLPPVPDGYVGRIAEVDVLA